jgi:dTDP-4-amino-4,6-dideoxygalactose transaminase
MKSNTDTAVDMGQKHRHEKLETLARRLESFRPAQPVRVTQTHLPDFDQYVEQIRPMWESKWITNNGGQHQQLERRLSSYLDAPHTSLLSNGTLALLLALKVYELEGEVITTPFTFPATAHSIVWNGLTPVFADIDPVTFNLDPQRIEEAITPKTSAILAVHVYGTPCDVDAIETIANRHNLKVIYDAAHTFGARLRGTPLAQFGDAAVLSFHATKLFHTIEGGAVVVHSEEEKRALDLLKNFGIQNEESVVLPGINAKMSEFHAAMGCLELSSVDEQIRKRKQRHDRYCQLLGQVQGITLPGIPESLQYNYAYFPILIDPDRYGLDRNEVYSLFKKLDIYTRKYFYPLLSTVAGYEKLSSADPGHLPVASRVAEQVLCLPMYGSLNMSTVDHLCEILTVAPGMVS